MVKPTYLAIVQRDRPDVIASLRRMPAGDIRLLTDRRQADRRAAPARPSARKVPERRRAERRLPPPSTWETQGFIIVPAPTTEA